MFDWCLATSSFVTYGLIHDSIVSRFKHLKRAPKIKHSITCSKLKGQATMSGLNGTVNDHGAGYFSFVTVNSDSTFLML